MVQQFVSRALASLYKLELNGITSHRICVYYKYLQANLSRISARELQFDSAKKLCLFVSKIDKFSVGTLKNLK